MCVKYKKSAWQTIKLIDIVRVNFHVVIYGSPEICRSLHTEWHLQRHTKWHSLVSYCNISTIQSINPRCIVGLTGNLYEYRRSHTYSNHRGLVTHIWVSKEVIIVPMAYRLFSPSHFINQWWNAVSWMHGNVCTWNSNRNSTIFRPFLR